jgi:NAD(P)-dependent dehydrogenase (short-subunit alcohol dehydrogenase family)
VTCAEGSGGPPDSLQAVDLGLRGHAAVVTGASSGIGAAAARRLAAEGARLLLVARRPEPLEEVAAACRAEGAEALALALDVTAPDAGERTVAVCLEAYGRLDAVVCNAGTSERRPMDELTDAEWQEQWELHVMGPMRLMRAAAPVMADAGGGRIVNVASSSGKRPSLTNVAYSVTKAAQLSLSRAWAEAWAARGVCVNAVAPGPVETPLWMAPGGLADQVAAGSGVSRDEALAAARAKLPRGRFGTEDEIAVVVTLLCSPLAANVVGAAWSVDGGAVPTIV